MKKILLSLIIISVIATFSLIGCEAATTETTAAEATAAASVEGKMIGFAQVVYANPFAKAAQDLFTKEANALGMEVTAADANLVIEKQIADIEDFIVKKVDLIVFIPFDLEASQTEIKMANDAGIPIIAYINIAKPEEGVPLYTVKSDNYMMGKAQAEYFIEALPENAKILYMPLEPYAEHTKLRRDGFMETFTAARPDVEILSEQFNYAARDKAMAIMEDWIITFPEFDAVICQHDEGALGALQAIKAAGLEGKVMVAGIDATQEALDAIKGGSMHVTVLQPAKELGKATAEVAAKILKGEEVEYDTVIPPVAITPENINEYIEYWK